MKKRIVAGKNFSVNTKINENPDIIKWLNAQANLTDSIRYLIEQDIIKHGVRNLQQTIPAFRFFDNERTAPISSKNQAETEIKITMNKVPETEIVVNKQVDCEKASNCDNEIQGVSIDVINAWN